MSENLLRTLAAGGLPERVRTAATDEGVAPEDLAQLLLAGEAVIPAGNTGRAVKPTAIGRGLRTKVNANIGASTEFYSEEAELEKLTAAVDAGADAVMDLSSGGDVTALRRLLLSRCAIPFGTVPIYEAIREKDGDIVALDRDDLLAVVQRHADEGVDFMTIHAGLTRSALDELTSQGRLMDVVSRGGAFMIAWMLEHDRENPFYEEYDALLEIMARRDITISLGDGLRPGCVADATDRAQISELVALGRLGLRAREAGVQVMIEGPGHVPVQDIEANVKLAKRLTDGAPFYVLGPLVTDVAPGYDHITAAIGGTVAGAAGADFLCYVTAAEHLGLPMAEDVRQGVMVSRIAAHAADLAKGVPGAADWDRQMARARKALDWDRQIELAIDSRRARDVYDARKGGPVEGCSMCGKLCAMKLVSDQLGIKAGDISGC